jgi:hypothetical protein
MDVESYDKKTRETVEGFLKERKQAISSEIVRVGTNERVINWQSLKMILDDLKKEGLVREIRIGKKVLLYEWQGR